VFRVLLHEGHRGWPFVLEVQADLDFEAALEAALLPGEALDLGLTSLKELGATPSGVVAALTRLRLRRALRDLEAVLAVSCPGSTPAPADEPPLERASRDSFSPEEVAFVLELVAAIEALVWCIRRLDESTDIRCYVKALTGVLEATLEVTSRLLGP
jgi:hypothetical protein